MSVVYAEAFEATSLREACDRLAEWDLQDECDANRRLDRFQERCEVEDLRRTYATSRKSHHHSAERRAF